MEETKKNKEITLTTLYAMDQPAVIVVVAGPYVDKVINPAWIKTNIIKLLFFLGLAGQRAITVQEKHKKMPTKQLFNKLIWGY